jgi:hypothetical protein
MVVYGDITQYVVLVLGVFALLSMAPGFVPEKAPLPIVSKTLANCMRRTTGVTA